MSGIICGTGSYVPPYSMDNNDIAKLVETSDEWIRERTGVVRRHIIQEETTVSMAARAGQSALENAGVRPEEVDLILVSTISSNVILPCAACEVQRELGYNTAAAYLEAGVYQTALVIGSESLSNLTNWKDRSTCILFGDGAGAAVIRRGEGRHYLPVTHSNGAKGGALTCKSRHDHNGLTRHQEVETLADPEYFMQMDGQAVFKFAVRSVPQAVEEVLEANQVKKEEISCYILHQANRRIVEAVAKRLGEPLEKFPMNLQEYGNTSSASIPILLDEQNRSGKLKKGDRIVLAGFGAGLSWGASILDWE